MVRTRRDRPPAGRDGYQNPLSRRSSTPVRRARDAYGCPVAGDSVAAGRHGATRSRGVRTGADQRGYGVSLRLRATGRLGVDGSITVADPSMPTVLLDARGVTEGLVRSDRTRKGGTLMNAPDYHLLRREAGRSSLLLRPLYPLQYVLDDSDRPATVDEAYNTGTRLRDNRPRCG